MKQDLILPDSDVIDNDQKQVLYLYSLYSDEANHTYLQYTAACALVYHLSKSGVFCYNLDEYLVYDYKEERRYIWESKKFMTDINILRDYGLLIRARSRSKTSRDVNAHQCSTLGHKYLYHIRRTSPEIENSFIQIEKELTCENGKVKTIKLYESGPAIKCSHRAKPIDGFLKFFDKQAETDKKLHNYKPFFLE